MAPGKTAPKILISVHKELIEDLDALASVNFTSRSDIVRRALVEMVTKHRKTIEKVKVLNRGTKL